MKRYYLSKITSAFDPSVGAVVNRHRLQAYPGVDYVGGEIDVNPQTGVPTQKALLVLVGGIDHAKFGNDPNLVPLPQVAIDMKVSSIHTATKLKAKSDVTKLGFTDVETVWGNADGLRDVINHYGRLNNPNFDAANFDLDES